MLTKMPFFRCISCDIVGAGETMSKIEDESIGGVAVGGVFLLYQSLEGRGAKMCRTLFATIRGAPTTRTANARQGA